MKRCRRHGVRCHSYSPRLRFRAPPMPPHLYYTLFMLLALAVFLFVRRLVPKPPALQALPWWTRTALALAGFIGGAFGAKVPFLFGVSDEGWLSLLFRDGKTITTGLIGAYLAVELAKL